MGSKKTFVHFQVTTQAALEFRTKQSVRTTFKLPQRCIDALSILAGQLGIKQKSLFDQLVDDVQTLKAIAREFERFPEEEQRIAKTYVVSRGTVENLERVATASNTPRDALVQLSIERIMPLLEIEREKHAIRSDIAERLAEHLRRCSRLLEEAELKLGQDDPVVQDMMALERSQQQAFGKIAEFLKKGRKMDEM